jgi:hypothetical protein
MGQEEPVSIRPAWGGPSLKKHASLTFRQGVLEATDGRGRARAFSLSDTNGPYRFAYGDTWEGEADYALVDRSGYAVLLVDQKAFRNDDIIRLQKATGLANEGMGKQPPTRPDAIALLNPPYLKWAGSAFAAGAVAFGLWSVTHVEILVLGITLPALIIMVALLTLAKKSMMSGEEFVAESTAISADSDSALADADAYLAEHGQPPESQPDDPPAQAPPYRPAPPDTPPHGH